MNRRPTGQKGFTLVELLVVVAIVGILAAIAIPQYAVYKQKAVDADMQAALHSGRESIEAYYVDAHTYVGADPSPTGNLHVTYGFRANASVTASGLSDTGYVLCAQATGGTTPAYLFSSSAGVMRPVASCP